MNNFTLFFIGGGNMAQALIGGQIRAGRAPESICVVDPSEAQRQHVQQAWGVRTLAQADASLESAAVLVWAVKPQLFAPAAAACGGHAKQALQVSVMAGIPSSAIVHRTGATQVVRTMPNTPALIGQGVTGVFAGDAVTAGQRAQVQALLEPTGELVWVEREADLDAVTALSGSGPAYVFYFVEAMMQAAQDMGLTAEQGKRLALGTFAGATALAQGSQEPPQVLRERVTSKGGTTHAAISHMEETGLKGLFIEALRRAQRRAAALGEEFGADAQ
jgi:pyrroline-5-carboxylate reductase